MSLFEINYNTLVKILLPPRLRNNKMYAWLRALTLPVVYIYTLFKANRSNNLYILSHSSQVVYMQAMLNDRFDTVFRRIVVTDGPDIEPVYTFLAAELKPAYTYTAAESKPQSLPLAAETVNGINFLVQVPFTVSYDPVLLKALIDKYRLPTKSNYLIQTI